jgi:hypothetical protein
MIWTLTPAELEATEAKIATINARAAKRGFTGRLTVDSRRTEVTEVTESGLSVTEVRYETTLGGDAPCYNGWTLLAVLDWEGEDGLIVRTAPGVESVNRDSLVRDYCGHCNTTRNRRKIYLVGNADGTQVQVGSTCLKDFLGWTGNPVFYGVGQITDEIDGMLGAGCWEHTYTTETVLAAAWAATTMFGYVKTSDWSKTPTKNVVLCLLDPRSQADRELARDCAPVIANAAGTAAKVREFILSEAFSGEGEYVRNLKVLAGLDEVSSRNIGILASAPQAWARAQERTLIRERERADVLNEFVGSPKARLVLTVRVKAVQFIPGDYGTTTLYTMTDEAGHQFKWFARTDALGEEPSETLVTIRGTVKKHEEYQGQRSTVLTRCAVQ